MKTNRITISISVAILAFSLHSNARESVGGAHVSNPANNQEKSIMSGCINATAQVDLDINNVRAKILNGGDMWWDIFGSTNARYEVPKVTGSDGSLGASSQFATALWVGGYDAGGQLKCAAQTYRQFGGNDYWPGPLTSSATTDATTCLTWDKFWKINRADVQTYFNYAIGNTPTNLTPTAAMDVITTWPAYGPEGQALAPYYDYNGNGIYDPEQGDVPDFDITGTRGCAAQLLGDQCIYWVFNDKGNIHTESGCAAIGLEIQTQAFAFATTDELNNATFLRYKIINKSSFRLDSTFFGIWDDVDLGYALDDYVGCDVERGLGIGYNGTAVDGSGQATAYGANPPAVGIDFFEGPFADPNNQDDLGWPNVPHSFTNYKDGIIDNERLGMGRFLYYNNNTNAVNGEPGPLMGGSADDFYQYLTGTWKNGTPMTFGGDGTTGSLKCKYMFPGISDPVGFGGAGTAGSNWSEVTAGDVPNDRRFVESSGPFKLQPGAVNTITVGVPWARATQGGPLASVALLLGVDDKAQELFNNCFAALDGPTAPNLTIQELDKELILYWSNPKTSNNYNEKYSEDYDKTSASDSVYRFQGYQLYQLKDGQVSLTDLQDVTKSRLVYQCDKVDGVSQIVNYYNDPTISAMIPKEMVNGANKGITHSIKVTDDKFASGDNHLINHKTYYFAIIAYGYTPTRVQVNGGPLKDYLPYIAGRKNADGAGFVPHAAIPHIPSPEANGTGQHSDYGTGPKLRRIEGQGNGGNVLDLTAETVSRILADPSNRVIDPVYENSHGPVSIQVIDPLNVPEGDFQFKLLVYGPTRIDTAHWVLTNLTTGEVDSSETTIKIPNEQIINGQPTGSSKIIPKWGLSVNIQNVYDPGNALAVKNSFLEATETFADPSKIWLGGLPDQEGETDANWIRSGTATFPSPNNVYNDLAGQDDQQVYEKVLSGTWAPYRLCASTTTNSTNTTPNPLVCRGGPAWGALQQTTLMKNLASVDVVIDYAHPENWTRCPVLEMQEETALAIGGARKMDSRKSASVDKAGRKSGDAGYNATEGDLNGTTGMGWFPGYAINIETGERLNMAFGEDSWLPSENGTDMLWNPTSNVFSYPGFDPLFGGKHYIYVFGHNGNKSYTGDPQMANGLKDVPRYDEGKTVHDLLAASTATINPLSMGISDGYKREAYIDAMWVSIPLLNNNHSLFETAVKIRLRVTKSYQKGYTAPPLPAQPADTSLTPLNKNYPMYTFNTSDIKATKNDNETAKTALDLINIVPNPYYAYSGYEQTAGDRKVKITNIPEKCTISIYSLNGTLIRRFKVDQSGVPNLSYGIPLTSQDWDLLNTARIPVSSGMYIIDVEVPNVGEKTLKWFGVMRPLDISAY